MECAICKSSFEKGDGFCGVCGVHTDAVIKEQKTVANVVKTTYTRQDPKNGEETWTIQGVASAGLWRKQKIS